MCVKLILYSTLLTCMYFGHERFRDSGAESIDTFQSRKHFRKHFKNYEIVSKGREDA